jgi:hypothetical protein
MLSLPEITAIVAATKGAVDIFDKVAGQIKSVLTNRPKEAEGEDDRWRYKIRTEGTNIIVKQQDQVVQTVTAEQLSNVLNPGDLDLVRTYEGSMNKYFNRWKVLYAKKDASQDPLVNVITEEQLTEQIVKMRSELLGILAFLEKCGVHLDDHYMNIRYLVEEAKTT